MKKTTRKLVSLLLALVMVLGMLPMTVFAAYEDGRNCEGCGHYHWDDHDCDCGYCSEDCESSCWIESHCHFCGACLAEIGIWCETCMACEDCMNSGDAHCWDCGKCLTDAGGLENTCIECYTCADCTNQCESCEYCVDCGKDNEMHCTICDACYNEVERCEQEGEHCVDCCVLCDGCDTCISDDSEMEFCDYCGYCLECCKQNSEDAGCSEGEVCVDSSHWDEHVCQNCYQCMHDIGEDFCEYCGFCLDCCAAETDCIDGMCVEDPEYADHICEDCGQCFCDVEQCESCQDNSEYRCVDCCADLVAAKGCDGSCGEEMCVNDSGLAAHIGEAHSSAQIEEHTAASAPVPRNVWSYDAANHWHECRLCENDNGFSENHRSNVTAHSYNASGVCTVCGQQTGIAIQIRKQPKNVKAPVSDIHLVADGPLSPENNLVSFSVNAKGDDLSYIWQYNIDNAKDINGKLSWTDINTIDYGRYSEVIQGVETAELTVSVPAEACCRDFKYRCVVSDDNGDVYSDYAELHAYHVYGVEVTEDGQTVTKSIYQANVTSEQGVDLYYEGSGEGAMPAKHINAKKSSGHNVLCIGEGCESHRKTTPHVFGAYTLVKAGGGEPVFDRKGQQWQYRTCKYCSFDEYSVVHEHDCSTVDEGATDENFHVFKCSFVDEDGNKCPYVLKEKHNWGAWQVVGVPSSGTGGAFYRECLDCDYPQNDYRLYDKDGAEIRWDMESCLVNVENGKANRFIVRPGESLTLTLEVTDPALQNKACTGWNVTWADGVPGGTRTYTPSFAITKVEGTSGAYRCTMPADLLCGGTLYFVPQFSSQTCTHTNGTVTENAVAALCKKDGYTGDEVCVDCGAVVTDGNIINCSGRHEGPMEEVPNSDGKTDHQFAGDCTHNGYRDERCAKCGLVVRKTLPKKHVEEVRDGLQETCSVDGNSGDVYCSVCGEKLRDGKVIPHHHIGDAVQNEASARAATCIQNGYTGDWICSECDAVLKTGNITPLAPHQYQCTSFNEQRHTLICAVCGDIKTALHEDKDANGICDVCSYAQPFTVTFDVQGQGTAPAAITGLVGGDKITAPAAPTAMGYIFNGWYKEAACVNRWDFDTDTVTSHITLYAKWTKKATGGGYTPSPAKPAEPTPAKWQNPFVDVFERDWFYDDVRFAYENELMNGTGGRKFSPYISTTRGMIVTILYRLEGEPGVSGACPFADVKSGSYYEDAITWAEKNGIVDGYGKGEFGPDDAITREQLAAILFRFAKYKGYDVSVGENTNILSYADAFAISKYAYPALQWACGEGLIGGYNGNLTPADSATRAQVAAILHRFMNKFVK